MYLVLGKQQRILRLWSPGMTVKMETADCNRNCLLKGAFYGAGPEYLLLIQRQSAVDISLVN